MNLSVAQHQDAGGSSAKDGRAKCTTNLLRSHRVKLGRSQKDSRRKPPQQTWWDLWWCNYCQNRTWSNLPLASFQSHLLILSISPSTKQAGTVQNAYHLLQKLLQNINFPSLLSVITRFPVRFKRIRYCMRSTWEQNTRKKPPKNNPIYPTVHLFTFPGSLWTAGGVWSLIGFSAVSCQPDEGF